MKRWVVKIDKDELKQLNPQQLLIGTLINTKEGDQYMVFRDNSSALKLASEIGNRNVELSVSVSI